MQRNCGLIRDEARGVGDFSSSSAKFCLSAFFLARRGIDFLERRARFFFFFFLLLTRKSERRERRESDGRLKNRGNKVEKKVTANYLVTYTDGWTTIIYYPLSLFPDCCSVVNFPASYR